MELGDESEQSCSVNLSHSEGDRVVDGSVTKVTVVVEVVVVVVVVVGAGVGGFVVF